MDMATGVPFRETRMRRSVLLHFDLGEVGIVKDIGEITDQRLIDTRFLFSHGI